MKTVTDRLVEHVEAQERVGLDRARTHRAGKSVAALMRSASRSRQFLCTVKQTVGKEGPVETVTDRLVEHVEELVHPIERPLVWGNPLLSTTPTPLAVHDLALRVEALEAAVREIARDLQRLLDDDCTR